MTKRREIPLGFSPERCLEGVHLCCVYRDAKERRSVLARYFQAGLEAGEKLAYVTSAEPSPADLEGLEPLGFDPTGAGSGLEVGSWPGESGPATASSPSDRVEQLVAIYLGAQREGYVGARAVLELTSTMVAAASQPFDQLAFEMMLSDRLKQVPLTTCCFYDASRLSGGALMDVLTVHPLIVVRSQLLHSPYYVEADQLMRELRDRGQQPQPRA